MRTHRKINTEILEQRTLPVKPLYLQMKQLSEAVKYSQFLIPQSRLVGCFGLNSPTRKYFTLYRAVSHRSRKKRENIDERKNVHTSLHLLQATVIQISRTPRHWKFTQHRRTTCPPLPQSQRSLQISDISNNINFSATRKCTLRYQYFEIKEAEIRIK